MAFDLTQGWKLEVLGLRHVDELWLSVGCLRRLTTFKTIRLMTTAAAANITTKQIKETSADCAR